MMRPLLVLSCLALLAPSIRAAEPARIVREPIEWVDVWVPGNNVTNLPKVLLIGDSITRGYYGKVEEKLKGKAIVARLTTSKSLGDPAFLDEVRLVLGQTPFDVVHFNNGLHGWGYTEEEYTQAMPELLATIRKGAPKARLIWATTTPVRVADKTDQLDAKTRRVEARNQAAAKLMAKEKIPTNDLFTLVHQHVDWFSRDGVHFNPKGTAALGEQVAEQILPLLAR